MEYLPKRLRTAFNPQGIQDWMLGKPGDIKFLPRMPYGKGTFHSFRNVPVRPFPLLAGRTHVSIGFNDLGELLVAEWTGHGGDPVRFVGYEASEYSVAKFLVVADMLGDPLSEVDEILQVWYSAAWSSKTMDSFRRSIANVLQNDTISEAVRALLRNWRKANISLRVARSKWLESQKCTWSYIGTFHRKSDRLALCRYYLTGEFLDAQVGSVVMFSQTVSIEGDENALNSTKVTDMLKHGPDDLVSNWISITRERIARLKRKVEAKEVIIVLHHRAVQLSDRVTIAAIRNLDARSMSWSNLVDYMKADDFFKLARAVSSATDTVHHVQSMNWQFDVHGAHLMDYDDRNTRVELIKASEVFFSRLVISNGLRPFLLCPPIDNILNLVGYMLARHYANSWFSQFVQLEGGTLSSHKCHGIQSFPDPHARTIFTMYMELTMRCEE
jgi:hypothetical protein